MNVVTDLAEIFRLGTAKARENLDFRRYLSARHFHEKSFQILASEVQEHIDCTVCANCCRYSIVSINKSEIEDIARYLDISNDDATRLYTAPDPAAPSSRILQNVKDGCVFLDGNYCLIYSARPKSCRDFPHVSAGERSLGSRPSSHGHWAALCPIIFNAIELYKHITGFHSYRALHARDSHAEDDSPECSNSE